LHIKCDDNFAKANLSSLVYHIAIITSLYKRV
jgi:hypothetical protein